MCFSVKYVPILNTKYKKSRIDIYRVGFLTAIYRLSHYTPDHMLCTAICAKLIHSQKPCHTLFLAEKQSYEIDLQLDKKL